MQRKNNIMLLESSVICYFQKDGGFTRELLGNAGCLGILSDKFGGSYVRN